MSLLLQRITRLTATGVFLASLFLAQAAAATTTPMMTTSSRSILDTMRIFGDDMGLHATDPRIIVARLVRVAMGFVGIIALLMILLSGASLMVSGGDEEKVASAKKTFFNTFIGLAIMLSAYSIVAFVLHALSAAEG